MIDIDSLKRLLQQEGTYDALERAFSDKGQFQIYGLSGSQKVLWTHALVANQQRPIVIVTTDRHRKEQWERDLDFFAPHIRKYSFPLQDKINFVATAKTLEVQAQGMRALSRLLEGRQCYVIATIEEAAQRIVAPDTVAGHLMTIRKSQELEREPFLRKLVAMGYERTIQVESRGHFAVRGDIVDIFTVNREHPVRIEFFGDDIDSIRLFDVVTQRSIDTLDDCFILPVKIDGPEESSLLSYAKEGLVVLDDPSRLQEHIKGFLREKKEHEDSHYDWRQLLATNAMKTTAYVSFLQQKIPFVTLNDNIAVKAKAMSSFERQIPLLTDEIKYWLKKDYAIVLVMQNLQRRQGLEHALRQDGIPYEFMSGDKAFSLEKNSLIVTTGLISEGFELPNSRLVIIGEGNIYGQQKQKLRKATPKGQEINYFTDLTIGDYVVHTIHGIGKYVGLKTIETEGICKDYVEIDYAGKDRLFLPTDKLGQLQKYIGNEGETPKLNKLGGAEWSKVTRKAQKSIDDLAEKLVKLYAEREVVEGFAFLPDQPWQSEFEEAFPYEETPDQLQATAEIKASMEEPHPMDRLLCGDVGFGKTEVAMRAIFKAVMSGKQVAVLVPTTILAQQHYQTFLERFSSFGVTVDVLNRFRTTAEKKRIVGEVQLGKIDVLIGTHSLLNKKIKFKDLGFLVVDEEQRFGVAQKEKWKEWAKEIDVLTLSATPIPRTLHMSLVGVREMSVINTPPEERFPVQTYVAEYDLELVVDAIRREISRGGQVFFVYNRVQSIQNMADILEGAMPDLKYCVAHGQMTGTQIESIMSDFYEGQYDLLLSTSIVENGIDVPNANTIIVYDADKIGLSQLYQMRGRVGRSHQRAYAYFLFRPNKVLTETAEKRLEAVKDFTELGSGFKVAMRDLEIRGAGNILGAKQHGNIAAVGFAMYCSMLEEAIARAHNKPLERKDTWDISINLKVNAFIDDAYISDGGRKISMYQRLLKINTKEALDDFVEELIDRFGTPTDAVENLIRLSYIREEARALGIQTIQLGMYFLEIIWADDSIMADWDMAKVSPAMRERMSFAKGKPTMLRVDMKGQRSHMLDFTEALLNELKKR